QEARAEIASRGGVMSDVPQVAASGGLFAWLFGKHDEEEEADAVLPRAVRPARSHHGGTEVAALRMNDENRAGAAPGYPGAPADRGNSQATVARASVPGKNSLQNEPNPAEADRSRVADLGSALSLRGNRAEIEQGRGERQERDAEAADIKTGKGAASAATAPVPLPRPRQPGDVAVAFADMPIPPARPASLGPVVALAAVPTQGGGGAQASKGVTKNEMISDAAASSGNSLLARAANLPVIITQGPKDRAGVPKQVLAFASEAPVDDPRGLMPNQTPGGTISGPAKQSPIAAPRLDRAKLRGLAGDIPTANFPAQSILGQSFTGLRLAARNIPDALSNRPSAAYVSAFNATPATDLDPGHFSGAAVRPLALAQGFVRIGGGPVPLRGN
ncbi:MAG: hypothetical protein ACREDH_13735, partial [Methylocella sp.]